MRPQAFFTSALAPDRVRNGYCGPGDDAAAESPILEYRLNSLEDGPFFEGARWRLDD